MIKKLLLKLLFLMLVTCLCVGVVACDGCGDNKVDEPTVLTGEHMLNGFNTLDDLYSINWLVENTAYSTMGKLDINRDATYIKEGDGSLKFEIISASLPEIRIQQQNTLIPDMDLTDLKTISAWVYNDNDFAVTATLNVLKTQATHLLTQSFELPAKSWTQCVMNVNAVVTKYAHESITGFSIQFMTEDAAVFYIDGLNAEFGRVFTEEDDSYVEKIEALIAEIKELPDGAKASDETAIVAAFEKYNSLPDLYKSAIVNFNDLSGAMKNLLYATINEGVNGENAQYERPAFMFDKFYGTTHMTIAHATNCSFGYSKEIKFGDEEGSTYIEFAGDMWNYVDISTSLMINTYDYVSFAVYNSGSKKAFWLNSDELGWNNRHDIDNGEWVEISVPVSAFDATGVQLIATNLNNGSPAAADGRIYVSQIRCHKLNQSSLYTTLLNVDTPLTATNANVSIQDGLTSIISNTDDKVELTITKTVKDITVGQRVLISFNISKATNLSLLNADGIEFAQIAVAEGWNTITLTADNYNKLSKIVIDAENGEVYNISQFYSISNKDEQAMRLIIERNYLPDVNNCAIQDLSAMIKYVTIYNDANLSNLREQFVKVTKNTNEQLYTEQENLYLSIIQGIENIAIKAKSLMEELVNSIDISNAETEKVYLLESVYNDYTNSKFLKPMNSATATKAENILAKYDYLPYRFIDVSVNKDRANFSIQAKYFPWAGEIVATENVAYGKVMAVTVKELFKREIKVEHLTKYENHANIELKYNTEFDLSKYDYIGFKIYNPSVVRKLYFTTLGFGTTVATFELQPNEWNNIYISTADFIRAGYMHFNNISLTDGTPLTFLFHDFCAYDEKYVQHGIEELPNANDIALSDELTINSLRADYDRLSNIFKRKVANSAKLEDCEVSLVKLLIEDLPGKNNVTAFDYEQIQKVRKVYDSLNKKGKEKISNYSLLQEVETAYKTNYKIIADMKSTDGFTLDANMGCSGKVVFSNGFDNVYKNYLRINVHTAPTASDPHLVIKHSLSASNLANCEKIIFYIYNGGTHNRDLIVRYNDSWDTSFKDIVLKASEWTKVELTIDEFIAISKFGIATPSTNGICEYKVSMFYATTAEYEAGRVVSIINSLPENERITALDGANITIAKNAYDALSQAAKELVTNSNKLETLINSYNAKYSVLTDMSSKEGFALNTSDFENGDSVSISIGHDVTYNNYLSLNVVANVTHAHLDIKYNANNYSSSLENCDFVYFYIYNGGNVNRKVIANFGGSTVTSYGDILLKAGQWTEVKVSKDDFISGTHFGIAYVSDSKELCEYKVSMIYATKMDP